MSQNPVRPSVNLARRLLGKSFSLFSPEAWSDHVSAMEKIIVKKVRLPRTAKPKVPHSMGDDGKCLVCGKKPRKPEAICTGPRKTKPAESPTV